MPNNELDPAINSIACSLFLEMEKCDPSGEFDINMPAAEVWKQVSYDERLIYYNALAALLLKAEMIELVNKRWVLEKNKLISEIAGLRAEIRKLKAQLSAMQAVLP